MLNPRRLLATCIPTLTTTNTLAETPHWLGGTEEGDRLAAPAATP